MWGDTVGVVEWLLFEHFVLHRIRTRGFNTWCCVWCSITEPEGEGGHPSVFHMTHHSHLSKPGNHVRNICPASQLCLEFLVQCQRSLAFLRLWRFPYSPKAL